jgi:hypothetical protein
MSMRKEGRAKVYMSRRDYEDLLKYEQENEDNGPQAS